MTDLVIRPLSAGDTEHFLSMSDPTASLLGVAWLGRDFRATLAARQYRPQWTYVAERDGRVVARAAWWAGPDDTEPVSLDWFDPGDDLMAGAELLRAAPLRCEYCLILPPDWRDRPEVRAAADARVTAAGLAGLTPTVERLRYVWTPADGLPERPERLTYHPVPDDDTLLDVLRGVVNGSLDAHERQQVSKHGVDAAARDALAFFTWMPSPRDWWRLAHDKDGRTVGLVVPGRNFSGPIIGYVGVLPGHRGHGYAYDLLVEGTHVLVQDGAEAITADTDTTNTPMVATFARAGYPVTGRRLMLS